IIKEQNLPADSYKPNMVYNRISLAKNSLLTPKEYQQNIDIQTEDELSNRSKMGLLYELYTKRCFKAGAMDFDDLLFNMYKLISNFPKSLYRYQHQFKHILIDEFQDTNYAQYIIVKKLGDVFENIFAVGDDAQSIYSFRGARIQHMLNFENDYPDIQLFKLEQNYRSTGVIVNAANHIISNNKSQIAKQIWTENEMGDKIKVIRALTDNDEGRLITNHLFEEKMHKHAFNSEFAILYRTNAQSRSFEESLRKLNIAYRVYGGISFYQRKEVKDLLAYLRLTVNPNDEEALKRVINYPLRGIGKTTVQKLIILADRDDKSIWDIIEHMEKYAHDEHIKSLGLKARHAIDDFTTMIKSFMTMLKKDSAYEIVKVVAKSSNILKHLYDDKSVEGMSRYENVQELMNSIQEFSEANQNEEDPRQNSLGRYLQEITLLTNADEDEENTDRVSLMTVHSAKGLEFTYVYIVGLEENLFPSSMGSGNREDLEEERRLFYVAVTRAKKKVTFSYAINRYRFGTLINSDPSRFIFEIQPEYIELAPQLSTPPKIETPPTSNVNPVRRKSEKVVVEKLNFIPEDVSKIQTGMQIEHSRFGTGKVLNLEGTAESRMATIFFPKIGQKKIMLKYAKLRILQD
ncbi:MAG: UvrD-helicase domain-containing protein, partial [Bacteroidetes bacterium]|nr:UvrD-helicase domain-containing protein [Bacteroidota bacterium]